MSIEKMYLNGKMEIVLSPMRIQNDEFFIAFLKPFRCGFRNRWRL
jgi:hypothetical protein